MAALSSLASAADIGLVAIDWVLICGCLADLLALR